MIDKKQLDFGSDEWRDKLTELVYLLGFSETQAVDIVGKIADKNFTPGFVVYEGWDTTGGNYDFYKIEQVGGVTVGTR